jgi:dethiobiotin synthetase
MTAYFVTATGTDIGKTFVTVGLIRRLRSAGGLVSALKPVATGFDPAAAHSSDTGALLAALSRPLSTPEIERISPWRYALPLSPAMAALRENRPLDFERLIEFCRSAIAVHRGTLLIEGIGGVMVPLDQRRTVLDWMATLKLPVLLVAGSYLGSLSHTLTALEALDRRRLELSALIVNETPGSTVPLADTVSTLAPFVGPVVPLRRLSDGRTDHTAFGKIAALL